MNSFATVDRIEGSQMEATVPGGRPKKKPSEVKSVFLAAQVDVVTKANLDRIAEEDDCSLARIIRQAVEQYIERRKGRKAAA